jgi:predicted O-methyltransferase YrrM
VTIEVAEEDADRARQLLAAADAGELRLEEDSSHS